MKIGSFKGAFLSALIIASVAALAIPLLSPRPVHAALTSHAPIYINDNSGFTIPNPVNGGGSGTQLDPYIIENWVIDASSADGITIMNTTTYFIVRNCLVENGGSTYYGIYLYNVINGRIENNICDNTYYGIYLYSSDNNTLTNNNCSNNTHYGIYLYSSDNNTLTNNNCSNNTWAGILLYYSSNNNLTNNTCENTVCGIFLHYSSNNTLSNNTCKYNPISGIDLYVSNNNTFSNNTCENNRNGICLDYLCDYNNLINNTCENNEYGIWLDTSSNNTLNNNTCENNYFSGIYLVSSNNNTIFHNYLLNNTGFNAYDDGTNFWDSGYPSGGNYWSDWQPPSHPDADGDGIVDEPRPIEEGTNQDSYPLVIGFSGSGSGTAEDPYIITTVGQLQEMRDNLTAHYALGKDIDASGTVNWNGGAGFEPVGTSDNRFTGSLDGRGYKIYDLYINRGGTDFVGLFGVVVDGGVVENVGLENENINGYCNVGGLVGVNVNYEGTISNCYSTGSVSGSNQVGGLVGSNSSYGTISNCYSTGSVSGSNQVGGLVGWNNGTVSNCYSTGSVSGNFWVSGLVGWNSEYGTVSNSYSTGSVSGGYCYVGGLVGGNRGTVSNCYSTGPVSGLDYVGGLVGVDVNYEGTISNCYSTGSVSGSNLVGGLVGVNVGTVSNCYSTGSVSGGYCGVGGLVGHNVGTVSNCYSTGPVSGLDYVGGLVGWNVGTVSNCYSTGSVSGGEYVGGLVGWNYYGGEGTVSNSFWDTQTSGQATSDRGTGKTTENMKNVRTYTDVAWSEGLNSAWDFVGNPYDDAGNEDIWGINPDVNDGYPFLAELAAPTLPDTTPPTISEVEASNITQSSATITWTTDEHANSAVEYGTTTGYGSTTSDATLVTNHSTTLTGLSTATLYHYRVKSTDAAGNMAASSDNMFTTETPIAKPVITSPLTIFSSSPYYPYQVDDTLTATFSITNRGGIPITFDTLVVGGRVNNDVVDFDKAYGITLNAGESYDYVGNLALEKPGAYYFFCAYYIENPTEEEKKLLDENNWNTGIPVEVEGEIITDPDEAQRYRAISIVVLEKVTYIALPSPRLWDEIHGPWEEISDDMTYEIRQIAVDPDNTENIYVLVQYKQWGWPGGYWPKSEDIFKLSAGKWEEITDELPFLSANTIAVAPSDPSVIYVGGEKRGVYRSVDGGTSWTSLKGPEVGWWIFKTNPRIFSLAVDPIDPNTVYVGTESGAWRKKDGKEWEQIIGNVVPKIETNPYETGTIYASSIVKNPAGIYRSGGILKSEDSGHSWRQKWTKGIANDIEIAKTEKVYVATGSYLTKFPLPGLTEAALIDFPVFADGILRYDGGDWESRESWHDARGKEGENPLPDVTPYSLSTYPDFPNMVFVAFPHESIMYSPDFGNNWFPLGLKEKCIEELLLADSNSPVLYAYGPKNLFKLKLSTTAIIARQHSAGELRVYDSQGNVTSLVNGEVKEEIPNSLYCDGTITIFSPIDSYCYELVGTKEGSYGLEVNSIEGEEVTTFTATDIPTASGAVHQYTIDWDNLSKGEEGVTVQIDSDGDGIFEHTFTSDSELTQSEYVRVTDKTPPTTTLFIGEPKYVTEITYVTPDTRFTLEANDLGSGVYLTAYRVHNSTYDSGWLIYTSPFNLTLLTDGVYIIEFNSTDNAGNIEATQTIQVTLFSWNYIFIDSYGRGTTLKINTEHKFFRFTTPDKDYGIREATHMRLHCRIITMQHEDSELRLITLAVDTKLDFCVAMAWDKQTHKQYILIDKVGIEK